MKALISVLLISSLIGCSTAGGVSGSTGTAVNLDHQNYRVIKAGARGEDYGFWLLFIPIFRPNYADAKANLYKTVGAPLEGKAVALANQTQDRNAFTLILFTIERVVYTADVVEFTDKSTSATTQPALN